ncbi:MAG: O-antigen ligase [Shinella sp.]|nr:O-antigen ligase [Shinella sp.]
MRIAKASLIQPGENQLYGIAAVALSLFVFAYSTRFGQVSVLVYYALWLPLVLVDYRRVLGNYAKYIWILGFTVFACLTVFWSAAPSLTARTGIQYLSHVICALIAMRTIDIRTLTRGAAVGIGLVLVYSLLFGIYLFDPLDGSFSFVGAFSSKNQLGFYASLGIYFVFAAVFLLREKGLWLGSYAVVGLIACYSLAASQSATSVLTTGAVIGLSLGMRVMGMLSPRHRKGILAAGIVFAIMGAAAFIYGGGFELVLGAFGKDATLTGRTYLWQQGMEAAGDTPIFGVGYQAYWVKGFSEAERLWDEFFIESRSGFHFHNTFIESMVETGLIGLLLLCLVLCTTLIGHFKRLLAYEQNPESSLLFGIAALLVVRAFVEIDVMTPYHVGSFLLYFAAGKLTLAPAASRMTAYAGRAYVISRRMASPRAAGV